ncbi:MAG: hypothetical protein FWC06_00890 [Treponema sp.]|nr:hypothetical protein [Treponema sp.]
MRSKAICLFFILALAGITGLNAQMTKAQLQDMYVAYLRSEGYQPSVDSDGDVNFTAQGHRFYIDVLDTDLTSFHLVLTNFLDIGGESNRLRALNAASAVTRTTKVVRLYITSSGRIAVDSFIFLAKPEDFSIHISRLVNIMVQSRNEFLDLMR